jgi:3',5'-cyclic AMP phosphodiesterase CpdA
VRSWPSPAPERTVHVIGDVHVGATPPVRLEAVLADLGTRYVPRPVHHLQVGDMTDHALPAEDIGARGWLARLPAPRTTIMGNHDILHDRRTPGQWAQAYGLPAPNYRTELPFVRILAVAADRDAEASAAGLLSPATLAWLDTELAAAPGDCWIACHWPIRGTVTGDTTRVFSSLEPFFHAKPDADIRALLARHPSATAWISGHTHSPLDAPGLVFRLQVGGRGVACINASALTYTGRSREWTDPLASLFLTHRSGAIEVRFRDHGAGVWTSASHQRVATVAVGP